MNERVVFYGTPEFAAYQLEYLVKNGVNVVGVVTAPDKPRGRGKQMTPSAVKVTAEALGLPVAQPERLKSEAFAMQLNTWSPGLQVVVAFRMLPEKVWNYPPHGTINLHASYLPHYRGAAPINHCIMNGERETGISTFLLQHAIDTGDILKRKKITIPDNWNAGDLHDALMHTGAPLLLNTVREWLNGTLKPQKQDMLLSKGERPREAPKIFREDMRIDWTRSAHDIHNKIRGLSPYPGAFTLVRDRETGEELPLKLFAGTRLNTLADAAPGTLRSDGKNYLHVATGDEWINIAELQMPGKKRMDTASFLRGYDPDRMTFLRGGTG